MDTELYLRSTDIIDWKHHAVVLKAKQLAAGLSGDVDIARACYEWVRDNIDHSGDHGAAVTTCSASQVLTCSTGWCFAKAHLLAALLRANGIPAGLCYQRLLRDDRSGFILHGLNAVFLQEYGWYRIDARGNRKGVDAQFCPTVEKLAWPPREPGEMDLPEIWADPLQVVVECLRSNVGYKEVRKNLPGFEVVANQPARRGAPLRVTVRTTRRDDLPCIADMQREWAAKDCPWGYVPRSESELAELDLALGVVAERDGEIVGYALCAPRDHEGACVFGADDRVIEIQDLWVVAELRGCGIGSRIVEEVQRVARGNGYTKLLTYSSAKDLDPVLRFYRGTGFRTWNAQVFMDLGDND